MKLLQEIKITIVLVGLCFPALSQVKLISLPIHLEDRAELYINTIESKRCLKFETKQMSVDTTFDEMYRFEIGGQLIEITRLGSTISGEVINFIYEENKNSSEFDYENPIFIKTKIHEDTSLIIYEKLKMLDAIPDMSRIDGWGAGLDGAIYKLEYGTKKMYSLRSYWSPSAQSDSVKFKNEIILFIEFLRKDLQIESHSVLLWRHLESGTYTIDGFGIYPIIRKRKRKKRR